MSYLLDTSVVTRLRAPAVADRLRELDLRGVARTSLTDLEVGFSARNSKEWDRLMAAVDALPLAEIRQRHLDRARQVQRLLAASGSKGRKLPDLIIAAVAEAADLTVVHYDADFDRIADVTGQASEWIVPAGSID